MRVTVNVSKKTLLIVGLCCVIGILILTVIPILEIQKTKNYTKVQAVITSSETHLDYGTTNDASKTSIIKMITCRYQVDEKEYKHEFRTFSRLGKKAGSSCTIYYNPEHPEKVRDKFLTECCIFGIGICAVFLLFVRLAVRQM